MKWLVQRASQLAALGTVVERFVLSKTRYSPLLAGARAALINWRDVLQLETLSKLGRQNSQIFEAVKICRHHGNCRDWERGGAKVP